MLIAICFIISSAHMQILFIILVLFKWSYRTFPHPTPQKKIMLTSVPSISWAQVQSFLDPLLTTYHSKFRCPNYYYVGIRHIYLKTWLERCITYGIILRLPWSTKNYFICRVYQKPIQATQKCNVSVQSMPLYLTARSTHTKPPHLRMSSTEPKTPSPCWYRVKLSFWIWLGFNNLELMEGGQRL
jgi:hypothetical protein